MGTRHLTVVVKDGEYKVAQYGQWDGYPTGAGNGIQNFLKSYNREKFLENLDKCKFISSEEVDKKLESITKGKEWISFKEGKEIHSVYPEYSRDTGCDILKLIEYGKVTELWNDIDFAKDSLFCEWAYVIDFDNDVIEIYKGFNKALIQENERFFDENKVYNEYYPVKLFKTFTFEEYLSLDLKRLEEEIE